MSLLSSAASQISTLKVENKKLNNEVKELKVQLSEMNGKMIEIFEFIKNMQHPIVDTNNIVPVQDQANNAPLGQRVDIT